MQEGEPEDSNAQKHKIRIFILSKKKVTQDTSYAHRSCSWYPGQSGAQGVVMQGNK